MRFLRLVSAFGVAAAVGGAAYARWVRPWHLRWGAAEDEARATLPGDEFAPWPEIDATHAVTVDVPPEEVWPWIVQIGADKGGFYSYSWLENLFGCGLRNADRIFPEWQDLRVGDRVWLHPKVGLEVKVLEPNRTLVLDRDWSFNLSPLDEGRTRLIIRNRGYFENPSSDGSGPKRFDLGPIGNLLYWRAFFEPAHFLMERKMLTGIKSRAEAAVRRTRQTAIDGVLPESEFRGEISVTVAASPQNVFRAFGEVTSGDMPIARALGEVRYLPGRLLGRNPVETSTAAPFIEELKRGGTVVLSEEHDSEIVFGSVGKYHQIVDQEPVPLQTADDFRAFDDPDYEKLVMAVRAEPSATPGETVLTLEHRTHALGEEARRRFARYWLVIKPTGGFVTKQLLLATKRRAERYERGEA